MGYKVVRRTADINFASDHPFHGAEVKCRFDVDFDTFFEYQNLAESKDEGSLKRVLEQFGDNIIQSWNLEDEEGRALPVSGKSFLRQPIPLSTAILEAWLEKMVELPAPLVSGSRNGGTSPARSTRRAAAKSRNR